MNTNFYFYYGVAQQWLLANGAKRKEETAKNEPVKVQYFDELPSGIW